MKRFKAWLIKLLGGFTVPVEAKRVFIDRPQTNYEGLGRPLDVEDWHKLSNMHSWGEVFFRFVAFELKAIDEEESRVPLAPDKDRDRLSFQIRRACLRDIQKMPDAYAARLTAEYNKLEVRAKEKGLNNHGK